MKLSKIDYNHNDIVEFFQIFVFFMELKVKKNIILLMNFDCMWIYIQLTKDRGGLAPQILVGFFFEGPPKK
jgi:hypothetical protein